MNDPCFLGVFCPGDVISACMETWQEGITQIGIQIDLEQYQKTEEVSVSDITANGVCSKRFLINTACYAVYMM